MSTLLVPLIACTAVILCVLLLNQVWTLFFDSRTKAKKERLQTIHNTVHWGGKRPGIAQATLQESIVETWLRSHSGTYRQYENIVQRAHSQLSAGQLMLLMLAIFSAVMFIGLQRHVNPLLLLVPGIAFGSMPLLWLSRKAGKRRQAFEDKLPETLDYISRALRAGHSLTSALGMVSKEFPDPVGYEFKIVADEMAFGIPFKVALNQLGDRVQSNDVDFLVISLTVQHETGGNLTELLDGLASTIRERFKLRGKIRTLSSEGRTSAWILGSMPFIMAGIITLINPKYASALWTTPQGQTLILVGLGLMTAGVLVLNQMIRIKV